MKLSSEKKYCCSVEENAEKEKSFSVEPRIKRMEWCISTARYKNKTYAELCMVNEDVGMREGNTKQ